MRVNFGSPSDEVLVYEGATTTIKQDVRAKPFDTHGTPIKFTPVKVKASSDFSQGIMHCVTVMDQYSHKSQEELRLEDLEVESATKEKLGRGPMNKSSTTTTSFSFSGGPVNNSSTTTPSGFSFGAGPVNNSSTTTPSGFSFGAGSVNNSSTTTSSEFSFSGGPMNNSSTTTSSAISFGGGQCNKRTPKSPKKAVRRFGGPVNNSSTTTYSAFPFGAGPVNNSSTTTSSAISFGAGPVNNSSTTTPGFSFAPGGATLTSSSEDMKTYWRAAPGVINEPSGSAAPIKPQTAFGFSPGVSWSSPSPRDRESQKSAEKQHVIDALFETQLKCLRIQNALQRLLLLRAKNFLRPRSSRNDTEESDGSKVSASQSEELSKSAICESVREESEALGSATELLVPEDLGQPLEALLRCSGIQIALQKNLSSLLTVPATYPGERHIDDGELSEKREGATLTSRKSEDMKTYWRTTPGVINEPSGSAAPIKPQTAFGFSPGFSWSSPSPRDRESQKSAEKQHVIDALFETQLKCLRIQNALQRLLLLRAKNFLRPRSSRNDTEESDGSKVSASQIESEELSKSAICESVREECEALGSATELVPEDLGQPLEALLLCGGIQIALQKNLSSLLTVPATYPGERHIDDGDLSEIRELSQDERLSETCSQLERIFTKSTYQCEYKRNPFHFEQRSPADSNDTVQETVLFCDRSVQTIRPSVPHGMGKLSTVTGQVIYKGQWHKGKRHGKGEALVVSSQSTSADDTCGYYEGNWKNNMRHGYGSMLFSSGAKYDGQWQYDKMSGRGVMKCRDGAVIEGTWREGFLSGCGLFTWPHGVKEYRQYQGERVLHSCPVDQRAAEEMSRKHEQSTRVQLLSERLQQLKLQHGDVTDMIEDLRSTQRAEMQELRETFSTKIEEHVSGKVAAALNKQGKEYEKKITKSAAKLSEVKARSALLELEVEQGKRESRLCQICFDRRRDCIIMPCTHLLYCRQCLAEHKSNGKNNCPACRGPINGEINCNLDV